VVYSAGYRHRRHRRADARRDAVRGRGLARTNLARWRASAWMALPQASAVSRGIAL